MTVTATYAEIHAALAAAARRYKLTPTDVRVALAVYEYGGPVQSDALAGMLLLRPTTAGETMLRRSLLALYEGGFAVGQPRKPGVRTTVSLTLSGRAVAESVSALMVREAA